MENYVRFHRLMSLAYIDISYEEMEFKLEFKVGFGNSVNLDTHNRHACTLKYINSLSLERALVNTHPCRSSPVLIVLNFFNHQGCDFES